MRELSGVSEIPQLPMLICLLNYAGPGRVVYRDAFTSIFGLLGFFVALSADFFQYDLC